MTTQVLTLRIDGREVSGLAAETILHVARENDISIPTLCALEGLSTPGSCRLCMVQINGSDKLHAACVTPIQEGMVVTTQSDKILQYRRAIIELLFSERNHVCAVCVANGHCELQDLAREFGVDHVEMAYRFPALTVDASHSRFVLDHNRCVLCTRCVRVCAEIEGAHTWDIKHRGIHSLIVADLDTSWGASETCTGCGKCVHVCPTGALCEKGTSVAELHKKRPFLPYLLANRTVDRR
ncbi:NAD(P)-dependent nickel-iron dehydrogenase diaphorase component subunit HoxU [Desulfobulbus propionicus DSM 2032]|uniref:NAD(P)-dependent nickel-iron dehydrogenase diaphorase component subunit HoxU n=1 Tax=Desulfobulbus propionicus (strain ATCC 33891 / DSM 2032 / VKM B-1956 / 1pr3) TaxID=577650 RepID=A0A7U3YMQ7_DESPD|nr:bidirectional hydrogenase complex protein HoxU [Desulfobulbus propionicus]ADW18216.1 NAD(P)-dependent nickel-iron dehydrogenase diaphorase component subunit HoxU [Desulfobulbus propionicus DSM 2032]